MGRKPKLTPQVHKKLVDMIRGWNYVSTACTACRITEQSYYNWEKSAHIYSQYINSVTDDNEQVPRHIASLKIYFDLFEDIKNAEAESEAEAVGIIRKGAKAKNWIAAATWLSRRFKTRWRDDTGLTQDNLKMGLQILDRLTLALERPGGSGATIDQPPDQPLLSAPQ